MAKLYVKHKANGVGGVYQDVGRNKASFRTFEVRDGVKRGDSVYVLTGGDRVVWVYTDRLLANKEYAKARQPSSMHNFKVQTESGKKISVPNPQLVKLTHCVIE